MDEDRLWTITDVAGYLGVSVRTARDVVVTPDFPPRIRLSGKTHRWVPADVRRWVRSRQDPPPRPARRVSAW